MSFSQKELEVLRRRRQEFGRRGTRRQAPRPRFPHTIERNYQKKLLQYIEILEEAFNQVFEGELEVLREKAVAETRVDDFARDVDNLLNATRALFERRKPQPERVAREAAEEIDQHSDQEFKRVSQATLGVAVLASKPFIDSMQSSFVRQNVTLIENLGDQAIAQLEGTLARGLQRNETVANITAEVQERFAISRRRAQNIATNEITTYNGALNRMKQESAGITRYRWSTSNDDRVRESHAANEGKVFEWSNPPATGNPGDEINCRCVGIPLMEDLIDSVT